MITSFSEFINESNKERYLNYYAFDWDDNILTMPTIIHMEKRSPGGWIPVDVSTSEFAKIRQDEDNWRLIRNTPSIAFSEFKDNGPRGEMAFISDMRKAIKEKTFGPSWDDFIKCLINGSLFAIITARGHEPQTIRKGVEWIINNYLSKDQLYEMYDNLLKFDYLFKVDHERRIPKILKDIPSYNIVFRSYLNQCDFVGVSNDKISKELGNLDPEEAKEKALLNFKEKINSFSSKIGYKAKIGFSDDDIKNIEKIENLVDNLKKEDFPNIVEYTVKNTKNPQDIKVKKKIVEFVDPSKQSIIGSTTFGNMTSQLHPSSYFDRQDAFKHQHLKRTEFIKKFSKEILDKEKSKNKVNKLN